MKNKEGEKIIPIARLGYRPYSKDHPEQSLEAYHKAYLKGHRIFLCDVRLTKDKKIVCVHDDDISAVSARKSDGTPLLKGEVLISETTLKELLEYDFSAGKGAVIPLKVLRLEDFIAFCKKYPDVMPCIEFKSDLDSEQMDYIASLVKKHGYENNIMFVCYHKAAQSVIKRLPNAIIGRWVNAATDSIIEEMATYGTKAFVYVGKEGNSFDSINEQTYKKAKSLGVDLGFTYISASEREIFDALKQKGILSYCKYMGLDEIQWLEE